MTEAMYLTEELKRVTSPQPLGTLLTKEKLDAIGVEIYTALPRDTPATLLDTLRVYRDAILSHCALEGTET